MATATISDFVIWAKHLHGDPGLASRVLSMKAGEVIELDVEGVRGTWRKMDDGRDGRPTPGLRPVGAAQAFWRDLFKTRRGELAQLVVVDEKPGSQVFSRSADERRAALAALLDGARQGSRSEGRILPREELYDR